MQQSDTVATEFGIGEELRIGIEFEAGQESKQ